MKKNCCAVLCCAVLITLTGCFSEKKSEVESVSRVTAVEEQLIRNAEKTEEAKNNAVEDMLDFMENDNLAKNVRKKIARRDGGATELSSADKLNAYFDELDKMELTAEETKAIDIKIEKIEQKYMETLPKPIEKVFEDGKVPSGMSETKEAIVVGGDIVIDKTNPENAMKIANLVRNSEGMPAMDNMKAVKRGFYIDNDGYLRGVELWPDGDVKYRFAKELTNDEEKVVREAMEVWREASGGKLKFIKYKNNSWNRFRWNLGLSEHIRIGLQNPVDDPCSTMGRGWKSEILMDKGNLTSVGSGLLHELGHSLGLSHEHQRPDRDNYIKINYDAIKWSQKKIEENYGILDKNTDTIIFNNKIKYTKEYDYMSIMHYVNGKNREVGKWKFENPNGGEFIIKNIRTYEIGGFVLSDLDKSFIKELY